MKTLVPFAVVLCVMLIFQACSGGSAAGSWKTLAEDINKGKYQAPNPPIVFKSEVFTMTDKPAQIVYDYQSPTPDIGGAFTVSIVEEGKDPMVDGAIPQVMVGIGADSGTQEVQFITAGKYYLEISGMGDWEVRLEQQQ